MKENEILLSESNLERVWMDEDWNVRIEPTELGEWFFALRDQTAPRGRAFPWGWIVGVASAAAAVGALSRYL